MKATDLTNNKRIDNVEVTKAGNGLNLHYSLDGTDCDVTGEFYIDKKDILHHEVIDAKGHEIEILVHLEF